MHIPVLLKESINALNIREKGIYIDLTLGSGGHSLEILKKNSSCRLYAMDRDINAIEIAKKRLKKYEDRLEILHSAFSDFKDSQLALKKINKADGILMDLGISAMQIENANRGFSLMKDGPLDMRMDKKIKISAKEIVNNFTLDAISEIFFSYGGRKNSRNIAKSIVRERSKYYIETTGQLAKIIGKDIKKKARIFQSLRIFVNSEMTEMKDALRDTLYTLKPSGRIAIITYHSLEDKIVKDFFNYEEKDCICPIEFPQCICDKSIRLKIINKKPIIPSKEEIKFNSKSRSAKLRIAERR